MVGFVWFSPPVPLQTRTYKFPLVDATKVPWGGFGTDRQRSKGLTLYSAGSSLWLCRNRIECKILFLKETRSMFSYWQGALHMNLIINWTTLLVPFEVFFFFFLWWGALGRKFKARFLETIDSDHLTNRDFIRYSPFSTIVVMFYVTGINLSHGM